MSTEHEAIRVRVKQLFDIVEAEAKKRRKKRPVTPEKHEPVLVAATETFGKKVRKRKPGAVEGPAVTLKELAYDNDLTPKELRRMLRKAGISRTGGRWEWPKDGEAATRILAIIKRRKKATSSA